MMQERDVEPICHFWDSILIRYEQLPESVAAVDMFDQERRALLPSNSEKRSTEHTIVKRQSRRRAYFCAIVFAVLWTVCCASSWTKINTLDSLPPTIDGCSRSSHVKWHVCGSNLHCGRLGVPLDYADTSAGDASIYMVKYSAIGLKRDRLGTLFVNPGGPGGSGSAIVHAGGKHLSDLTGGRYDIIGFDPRGINMSTPSLACFPSEHLESTFLASNPLDPSPLGPNTNLTGESYLDEVTRIQSQWKAIFQRCESEGETAKAMKYSSSANVVRDIVRISDVLEGPGKAINFLGYSYGTLLGSYLVNMYPDRVGRVVLDGVVNPITWTNGTDSDKTNAAFRDVEKVLDLFAQACAGVGSERCALAEGGMDASGIRTKVMRLIDDLARVPVPVPDWTIPTLLTSPMAARYLFQTLYRPLLWPDFANALQAAVEGNGLSIVREMHHQASASQRRPTSSPWLSSLAIQCIDSFGSKPGNGTLPIPEVAKLIADAKLEDVKVTGKMWSPLHVGGCWQYGGEQRGVAGRFVGPFDAQLNAPILIVGNIADPITPLHNAKLVQSQHSNAALLVHRGMGHTSLAQPSLCTVKAVQAYLTHGKLPDPDLQCHPESAAFEIPTTPGTTHNDPEVDHQLLVSVHLLSRIMSRPGIVS